MRIWLITLLGLSCCADHLDEAIDQREAIVYPQIAKWRPPEWTDSKLRDERHKNARRYLKDAQPIGEIVSAWINRTSDTKTMVIHLRTVDGRDYSLWLAQDVPCRSIGEGLVPCGSSIAVE